MLWAYRTSVFYAFVGSQLGDVPLPNSLNLKLLAMRAHRNVDCRLAVLLARAVLCCKCGFVRHRASWPTNVAMETANCLESSVKSKSALSVVQFFRVFHSFPMRKWTTDHTAKAVIFVQVADTGNSSVAQQTLMPTLSVPLTFRFEPKIDVIYIKIEIYVKKGQNDTPKRHFIESQNGKKGLCTEDSQLTLRRGFSCSYSRVSA